MAEAPLANPPSGFDTNLGIMKEATNRQTLIPLKR